MGRRANHRHSIQMPNCPHAGAALAWHVVILLRLALLITETGALPLGIMAVKNAMQNCKQHAQFHHDYTHCQRLSPTKRSHAVPCKGPQPTCTQHHGSRITKCVCAYDAILAYHQIPGQAQNAPVVALHPKPCTLTTNAI